MVNADTAAAYVVEVDWLGSKVGGRQAQFCIYQMSQENSDNSSAMTTAPYTLS